MITSRVKCDPEHIRQTLRTLVVGEGQVFELRALRCHHLNRRPWQSIGYFNDMEAAVKAVEDLDARCHPEGIYLVMNPCIPEVAARAELNRFHDYMPNATKDEEIRKRDWLMIDLDPRRPAGISSTEGEVQAAKDLAVLVADGLAKEFEFPRPLVCCSGNGIHLLYAVDFPNDDPTRALLSDFLKSVSNRYSTPQVKIDEDVYNASRMTRLYGTANRKGADNDDRPHRLSSILNVPESLARLGRQNLEHAVLALSERTQASKSPEEVGPTAVPSATDAVNEEILAKAKKYLGDLPPAIEGQEGSGVLWRAALGLVRGFSIPLQEAFTLLRDNYNHRCQPPWSEAEMMRVVTRAHQKSRKRRGFLLDEEWVCEQVDSAGRPLPQIHIDVDQARCVDEFENAIIARGLGIYQRTGLVVRIRHTVGVQNQLAGTARVPTIEAVPKRSIQEAGSLSVEWLKRSAKDEWIPTTTPQWAAEMLLDRPSWEFPVLVAIAEAPCLRPEGTVVQAEGYDPSSGLYLDLGGVKFPEVPESPTRDDALRAFEELKEVFVDFPFIRACHQTAAIAAILTLVGRAAINGCVPMFAVGAPMAGTGKGLLVDAISMVAIGRVAPRTAPVADGAEERKRLHSICIEGSPLMLFDNIDGPFRSSVLCAALTAGWINERLMGLSKMVNVAVKAVFFATGNNIDIAEDLVRRVIPINLDRVEESPEEHSGFKHPDLLGWITENRPRLVVAALTILRAFIVAGRPQAPDLAPFGSFEAWSGLIRHSIVWLGGADPNEGRDEIKEKEDPVSEGLNDLLRAWHERFGEQPVSLQEVIKFACDDPRQLDTDDPPDPEEKDRARCLKEALVLIQPGAAVARPDLRALGQVLRKLKGRIVGGKRLERLEGRTKAGSKWRVVVLSPRSPREPGQEG